MVTVETKYQGNKRTESTHQRSGNTLLTDAPVDNHGLGETFSPTDLVATALGSCMMTVMGIEADRLGVSLEGLGCRVTKVMAAQPRRIAELKVDMTWPTAHLATEDQREQMKQIAITCPVAESLHENLRQTITFDF